MMLNRIVSPDWPKEAPEPNVVPHPQEAPLEIPEPVQPNINPPQGGFFVIMWFRNFFINNISVSNTMYTNG
ncbi:MAG: hypothetical protein PWP31_577 [Clostridia bacterium]|nr:hypothetical protein [Clostridia bacterium]